MSPRRNRRDAGGRDLGAGAYGGPQEAEEAPDGDWIVRAVSGASATKTYRCPGCDHEIRPGVAHLVTWPADETGGMADRRHWHRPCWTNRHTRRPTRR